MDKKIPYPSEDSSILRATPAGYSSRNNPRQLLPDVGPAGGGGIVVFFKSSLRVTQVQLTLVPSSFEALCLSIATPRGPVTLLTVYRLRHLLFNFMRNLRQ